MKPATNTFAGAVVELARRRHLLHAGPGRARRRDGRASSPRPDRASRRASSCCVRACSALISARTWTRSLASRFESGSSSRNAAGSRTSARPIATRWRWPPESCFGRRSSSASSSSSAATRATRDATRRAAEPAHAERELEVLARRHVRDRARSPGTPSRRCAPAAGRRSRRGRRCGSRRAVALLEAGDAAAAPSTCRSPTARPAPAARRRSTSQRDSRRRRGCRPGRSCRRARGRRAPCSRRRSVRAASTGRARAAIGSAAKRRCTAPPGRDGWPARGRSWPGRA